MRLLIYSYVCSARVLFFLLLLSFSITAQDTISYIDLDQKISNIAHVLLQISNLDENQDSPLHELQEILEHGFSIVDYDTVIETVRYAEVVLQDNYKKLDVVVAKKLTNDLDKIIEKLLDGSLIIPADDLDNEDATDITRRSTKKIRGNLYVTGDALFRKHIHGKHGMTLDGKLKVHKKAHFKEDVHFKEDALFKENVVIEGNLSAVDGSIDNLSAVNLTVQNCMNNLCVNNFSSSDGFIDNLSAVNLTVDNCMAHLCVNNFSASDAAVENLTAANLTVDNCIENLCVDNLSAVDEVVSGTLLVNNFSATYLSVVDETVSGTLSVNDAVIDGDVILMNAVITGSLTLSNLSVTSRQKETTRAAPPAGVIHNDAGGLVTSSLIVDADVDPNAAIEDTKLATISTPGKVANSATTATDADVPNTIVLRDPVGNFYASNITANLLGNAATATTTANFTGPLSGDVTGTQGATVVSSIGGQSAAAIAAATTATNTATSSDTPNTIVLRDASGNFATKMITLDGTPTNPTDAATKAYVDSIILQPGTGTNLNTPNTLVQRDGTGSFAAQVISLVDAVASGNIVLGDSTSSVGNIIKGTSSFIHDFGVNNTFVGINAGNFITSGPGANNAFGANALTSITTGSNNIAIGYQAGQTITTGSGNIYIAADAATSTENDSIRIGTSQTSCFISGIYTSGISGDGVVIDSTGKLGITLSSERFKHDIHDMGNESENIMKLRPVTFVYINDETNTKQYGLIAEEVEKIFPAIVVKDKEGLPYTVRYQSLPVMLLNELQKQQAIIEEMRNDINYLRTEMQKITENKK